MPVVIYQTDLEHFRAKHK